MITVTKSWRDLPAAHRQHRHDGHCRLVHGHNWGFDITFACTNLDENGFVVDVGKLKEITEHLRLLFDHTLLINEEDPLLSKFEQMDKEELVSLVVVPNCGMEGLAELIMKEAQRIIEGITEEGRDVWVTRVVCWEDSKNRATVSADEHVSYS